MAGFEAVKTTPITEQPFWVNDTKLSHLLRISTLAGAGALAESAQSGTEISPASAIRLSKNRDGAEAAIGAAVLQKISSILMRPIEELDPASPISVYGLDSLVAIEIRKTGSPANWRLICRFWRSSTRAIPFQLLPRQFSKSQVFLRLILRLSGVWMPLKAALAKCKHFSLLRSFIAIFLLMSNFLPFGDALYSTQFSFFVHHIFQHKY